MTKSVLRLPNLIRWLAVIGLLWWAYSPALSGLPGRWWNDPDYTHGFLVPVFAVVLLWIRREKYPPLPLRGSLWGVAFLVLSVVMRWGSAFSYIALLEPLSLLPCVAGLVLITGGWGALKWAAPSIAFLVFMIPVPGLIGNMLGLSLQRIATVTSTFALQTLGIPAFAYGNVIHLRDAQLGVVEACSGLRMMMLFFSVCVGAAFLVKGTPLKKTLIVLSAAPIAVIANVVRITVTGVLYETTSPELAEVIFHDLAGWFMMPLAVVILWTAMAVLSRIFKTPVPKSELEVMAEGLQRDEDLDDDIFGRRG